MGEFKDRIIASMEPTADDERRMPHPWSSDPVAQAAVRAAENEAANWRRLEVGEVIEAGDEYLDEKDGWKRVPHSGMAFTRHLLPHRRRRVPLPDHRDLPSAVAELRERVRRLEAANVFSLAASDIVRDQIDGVVRRVRGTADAAPPQPDPVPPSDGLRTERVTLEIVQQVTNGYTPVCSWPWDEILEDWGLSRRGESARVVEQADASSDEAIAHSATLNALAETRESLAAANRGIARLTAERDAAIRERDAAKKECEDIRRKKNYNDRVLWAKVDRAESIALTAVEALRKISALDYSRAAVNGAAYDAHCIAKAALQSAPAANAGGEQQLVGLSPAERDGLQGIADGVRRHASGFIITASSDAARAVESVLARHTLAAPPAVANAGGGSNYPSGPDSSEPVAYWVRWRASDKWTVETTFSTESAAAEYIKDEGAEDDSPEIVLLFAAPQPPRGWLTRHERWRLGELVAWLKGRAAEHPDTIHGGLCESYAADIDAILARETPPRVRRPHDWPESMVRDMQWIAAIREAGGEVV